MNVGSKAPHIRKSAVRMEHAAGVACALPSVVHIHLDVTCIAHAGAELPQGGLGSAARTLDVINPYLAYRRGQCLINGFAKGVGVPLSGCYGLCTCLERSSSYRKNGKVGLCRAGLHRSQCRRRRTTTGLKLEAIKHPMAFGHAVESTHLQRGRETKRCKLNRILRAIWNIFRR